VSTTSERRTSRERAQVPAGGGAGSEEGRVRAAFTGIERTNRSQLVRGQIEQAIARGDFGPGDRLPSERELVRMLGVSRVSVREAMRSLEALGLVEVHQGRGCFVSAGHGDGYAAPFAGWLAAHRNEVLELLRVRGALDEVAAERAAERGKREELERVRAACEAFRRAAEDREPLRRLVELDIAFHEAVASASGSILLANLLRDLNTYLNESRFASLAPAGRPERSAREHERIVEAILAGRSAGARKAVARHLKSVRAAVGEPAG